MVAGFFLLDSGADCCRHSPAGRNTLAIIAYGRRISVEASANTVTACATACNSTAGCAFFSFTSFFPACVLCSSCDLTAAGVLDKPMSDMDPGVQVLRRVRPKYSSWARNGEYRPEDPQVAVAQLAEHLQDTYSVALYGAPGRVPDRSIRVLWVNLLPASALAAINRIGVCRHRSSMPPRAPFFVPISWFHPTASVWVHAATMRPYKSGEWVEVTHCPGGKRGPAWKSAAMWLYAAPGSGVSINVGRTLALYSYGMAVNLLARAFCPRAPLPNCHMNLTACPDEPDAEWGSVAGENEWTVGKQAIAQEAPIAADNAPIREVRLDQLDSIQVLGHAEHFSFEARHEIILLRRSECSPLRHDMPEVRCGRVPYLSPCALGSAALRRLSHCSTAPRLANMQPSACSPGSEEGCFIASNGSTLCRGRPVWHPSAPTPKGGKQPLASRDDRCKLVRQTSVAPCKLGRSFGCDPASHTMWVRNCRGDFRCGSKKVRCGYPPGLPSYNCSCVQPQHS